MWIDSHAHLDSPELLEDLDSVLQRADQAGVKQILTIGCVGDREDVIPNVLRLTEREVVKAALGVHPHDALSYHDRIGGEIADHMDDPQVVAWGEIGLDYHYDNAPRPLQREVFRKQIRLAREVGKPIIVHTREAEDDTLSLLQEEYADGEGPTGVLHCFTGSVALAQQCLRLGFYLGFGGILTFPKAENVRQAARAAPHDRLLVETDSPYLAPVPHRGKRNEPAYAALAGEKLAEVLQLPLKETARITSDNYHRLFGP